VQLVNALLTQQFQRTFANGFAAEGFLKSDHLPRRGGL
jgi:hypothetical protein